MKYGAHQAGDQSMADQLKPLSDKLDINKIAELKKKILSNRRTRIKRDGDEGERGAVGPWDAEADRTKEIISRERQWRTRTTILQSNGKQFAKNIFAILTSVKAREEGRYAKPAPAPGAPGARPGMPPAPRVPLPGYNRYGQELLTRGQAETEGFKIDTTGTYAGKTLKSVMDAGAGKGGPVRPGQQPHMPPPSKVPRMGQSPQVQNQSQQPQKGGKRVSRTPIIIIPAAPKSLVTMFNAKEILQDLKYVSTEEKRAGGAKRENDVLINRPGLSKTLYGTVSPPSFLRWIKTSFSRLAPPQKGGWADSAVQGLG